MVEVAVMATIEKETISAARAEDSEKFSAKDFGGNGSDEEVVMYTGDLDPKKYGHLERGLGS